MIPDLCIASALDNSVRGTYGLGSSLGGAVLLCGMVALTLLFLCGIGCLVKVAVAPAPAETGDTAQQKSR